MQKVSCPQIFFCLFYGKVAWLLYGRSGDFRQEGCRCIDGMASWRASLICHMTKAVSAVRCEDRNPLTGILPAPFRRGERTEADFWDATASLLMTNMTTRRDLSRLFYWSIVVPWLLPGLCLLSEDEDKELSSV